MNATGEAHPYHVLMADHSVQAWSSVRLKYPPRPLWQDRMVAVIATALQKLETNVGMVLHGIYASSLKDFVDVENVLYYNVSATPFARLTREGLRFERSFMEPPVRPDGRPSAHHHRYESRPPAGAFTFWSVDRELGRFETNHAARVNTTTKARDIWAAVRSGTQVSSSRSQPNEIIAVRVSLTGRASDISPAAGSVKPLFDGIISAFQAHDGADEGEIVERLGALGRANRAQTATWLRNPDHSVLGTSTLVRPWGASVQFYPADDLCVAGEILITLSEQGPVPPLLKGQILAVTPRAALHPSP